MRRPPSLSGLTCALAGVLLATIAGQSPAFSDVARSNAAQSVTVNPSGTAGRTLERAGRQLLTVQTVLQRMSAAGAVIPDELRRDFYGVYRETARSERELRVEVLHLDVAMEPGSSGPAAELRRADQEYAALCSQLRALREAVVRNAPVDLLLVAAVEQGALTARALESARMSFAGRGKQRTPLDR